MGPIALAVGRSGPDWPPSSLHPSSHTPYPHTPFAHQPLNRRFSIFPPPHPPFPGVFCPYLLTFPPSLPGPYARFLSSAPGVIIGASGRWHVVAPVDQIKTARAR